VPANLAELSVFADSPVLTLGESGFRLKLWDASDPGRVLLTTGPGSARASLAGLLVPGASYVAEASTCGDDQTDPVLRTLHFTVAASASDPPATLGPLRVARSGRSIVGYGGGTSCFHELVAHAVDLELDEDALPEPWRRLPSDYRLIVDGEPLTWLQTIGTGRWGPEDTARGLYHGAPGPFRAFTECEPSTDSSSETPPAHRPGLAPGKHTAWITARVPTAPETIVESERLEIELSCAKLSGSPAETADEHPSTDEEAEDPQERGSKGGSCSVVRRRPLHAVGTRSRAAWCPPSPFGPLCPCPEALRPSVMPTFLHRSPPAAIPGAGEIGAGP
jgi:hypothetical protein